MKRVAIVTATRAEYGLLAPIIDELRHYESDSFRVELIVTGTHLYSDYGMTIDEIKERGTRIDHEIMIPVNCGSAVDISNDQSVTLNKFTELFEEVKYSALVILGDRYEMLSVAIAAMNTHTPIFHISGGDITEGAIDDCIRHCITKMSYLHFTTNEMSRKRVIQMGEDPKRVFNYGSTSIDNILNVATLSKKEAMDSIHLKNDKYALCTYHPITLEDADINDLMQHFLSAIESFKDIEFIVTKSNSDQGGKEINSILEKAEHNIPNMHVFASLGVRRYLSLMKYSLLVLGNSSSGIIEAPVFHIPTVNIGNRQRGRHLAESIINCESDKNSIVTAINKALDPKMKDICMSVDSIYGSGHSAKLIAKKILEIIKEPIDLKKSFFDIVTDF